MRWSKPAWRAASAALAPARLAPVTARVRGMVTDVLLWLEWRGGCGAGRWSSRTRWYRSRSSSARTGEGEELGARARVLAQEAVQRRGDGAGAGGLHAAKTHAEVLGFEYDADAHG